MEWITETGWIIAGGALSIEALAAGLVIGLLNTRWMINIIAALAVGIADQLVVVSMRGLPLDAATLARRLPVVFGVTMGTIVLALMIRGMRRISAASTRDRRGR